MSINLEGSLNEWDRYKTKVTFSHEDSRSMYMAGFYTTYNDGDHFIILTTQANASMALVHDRMPLILEKDLIQDWILDDQIIRDFLRYQPAQLKRFQEYEQLSLF